MALFESFAQRSLVLRNRIAVSPMCQYSLPDGVPGDWHFVHLGSRAVGGASLVITEAAAVSAEGRISPADAGLWNEAQAQAWSRITAFIRTQGAIAGTQLAHAGRKASTAEPWNGGNAVAIEHGGWQPVAPSAVAFNADYPMPAELDEAGIAKVITDFRNAAKRSLESGFELIELHAAHGYLLHQFLSPLSNQRKDRWGGSFENRTRLVRDTL
ncbi:MAG: oxidoreductase, partial [Pseudoxanthomonas sp.]